MFAGPNGSGKSTLFRHLLLPEWRGFYLNPDEIEQTIKLRGFLDLAEYDLESDTTTVLKFFQESDLLRKAKLEDAVAKLVFADGKLYSKRVRLIPILRQWPPTSSDISSLRTTSRLPSKR